MPQQWFQTWFNSPYYHILYNNRNQEEAEFFINNLFSRLNPAPDSRLLDIACGRGRHAVCMNNNGYHVTGIDLSIANIEYAKQFENSTLHFYVHDMRSLFYNNYFDIALNLFTSFGYFNADEEHIKALKGFNKALKPGALLVLDFFNSNKMIHNLMSDYSVTYEQIDFNIHKEVQNNRIIKTIDFKHNGKVYSFKEMVTAFTLDDFTRFFDQSGFEITDYFGSYGLGPFDSINSDRLIFICKKANA